MGFYDVVGSAIASVRVSVDTAFIGVSIALTHRAGAAINLVAKISGESNGIVREGGIEREARVISMRIATGQPGFAATANDAEPIMAGDLIQFRNRNWRVLDPIGKDKFGRTYLIKIIERKRTDSGV